MKYKESKQLGKKFKAKIVFDFISNNPLNYTGASVNIWKYKRVPNIDDYLQACVSCTFKNNIKIYNVDLYDSEENIIGRFSFDDKLYAMSLKEDFECNFEIKDDDEDDEIWKIAHEETVNGTFNIENYINGKRISDDERDEINKIENNNPFLKSLRIKSKHKADAIEI